MSNITINQTIKKEIAQKVKQMAADGVPQNVIVQKLKAFYKHFNSDNVDAFINTAFATVPRGIKVTPVTAPTELKTEVKRISPTDPRVKGRQLKAYDVDYLGHESVHKFFWACAACAEIFDHRAEAAQCFKKHTQTKEHASMKDIPVGKKMVLTELVRGKIVHFECQVLAKKAGTGGLFVYTLARGRQMIAGASP